MYNITHDNYFEYILNVLNRRIHICQKKLHLKYKTVILNCTNISQYYFSALFYIDKCNLGEHKRLS